MLILSIEYDSMTTYLACNERENPFMFDEHRVVCAKIHAATFQITLE